MTVDLGGNPLDASPARTLGESLRNTRVAAGASIEQVEFDLRIKAKYIEAIEDGDIVALPSRAYTDGFLRNYATYLGHDPAETVTRFAGENGLTSTVAKTAKAVPIKVKHKAANPLAGIGHPPPRGSVAGSVGRGVFALWPLVLVAGLGFGGYTGFVAARDAGLIPPELGGIAKSSGEIGEAAKSSAEIAATPAPKSSNSDQSEASASEQPTDMAGAKPAPEDDTDARLAMAKPEMVGDESETGGARPDRLSYARTGATPYWQAKPPTVEPADGPVSEIEPETAGLIRAEAEGEEDKTPSLWSGSVDLEAPTSDADASRIAAEAREALAATLGLDSAPFDTNSSDEAAPTVAAVEEQAPANESPQLGTAELAAQPEEPTVPGIGPIETQPIASADLAPAEPAQAPRRFALIAQADTWVQVQDAIGTVTYTGILSEGEAYNIPNQEGLRLKTGNAGGLFIEVDGQRFGPLGSSGAVMRNVVLNPGAVRASFTLSRTATLSQ